MFSKQFHYTAIYTIRSFYNTQKCTQASKQYLDLKPFSNWSDLEHIRINLWMVDRNKKKISITLVLIPQKQDPGRGISV